MTETPFASRLSHTAVHHKDRIIELGFDKYPDVAVKLTSVRIISNVDGKSVVRFNLSVKAAQLWEYRREDAIKKMINSDYEGFLRYVKSVAVAAELQAESD